jgi:hypothetical protein
MKSAIFWDVMPCYAIQQNIVEDGILHSHRRESLKFYIALTGWAL